MLGMTADETRPDPAHGSPLSPEVTHLKFKTIFHIFHTLMTHLETSISPNLIKTQNRSGVSIILFLREDTQLCGIKKKKKRYNLKKN